MSEANNPLRNNPSKMEFPNIVSANAVQRQPFYDASVMGSDFSIGEDDSHNRHNVEALAALVQDLNQQNHELLDRIAALDAELTQHKRDLDNTTNSWPQPFSPHDQDLLNADHNQVAHLLNHLEFTQQANQRQSIRIESLSMQLESSQTRIAQLEAENGELQRRCSGHVCRLNQLDEECRDLRLRLQRQQQYTLQFKAALEKCLEVPPPSYSYMTGTDDFTVAPGHQGFEVPQSAASDLNRENAVNDEIEERADDLVDDDINWFVQPLFPKIQRIQSWAVVQQEQAPHRPIPILPTVAEGYPSSGISSAAQAVAPPQKPGHSQDPTHSKIELSPVFQSFPSSRFQSTLLNLAHEELQGDRPSTDPILSAERTESAERTDHGSEPCNTLLNGQLNEPPNESLSSSHDEHWQEYSTLDTNVTPDEQGSDVWDSCHKSPERDELASPWSDFPRETIPPFSVSTQGSELGSPDDKLWQSLVNLIDLSAADGLNIPTSPDEQQTQREPEQQESERFKLGMEPLSHPDFPPDISSESAIGTESTIGPKTLVPEQIVLPHEADGLGAEKDGLPSIQETLSRTATTQSRPSRRSIDLPSFVRVAQSGLSSSKPVASESK